MWASVRRVLRGLTPARRVRVLGGLLLFVFLASGGFMLIANLNQAQNDRDAEQRAAYYEHVGRAEAQRWCAVIQIAPKRLDCFKEVENRTREQQRREYEIGADRDSAVWNRAMGEAGFVGTLVAVITVLLVFVTYEAQVRNILETRRIGEAQTRCYLGIGKCKIIFNSGVVSVQPTLRNSGQSPALKVRWYAEVNFMTDGDKGLRVGETDPAHRSFAYDVPAQGERQTLYVICKDDFGLGPLETKAFTDGGDVSMHITIFAYGKDVFGRKAETEENFLAIFTRAPRNAEEIEIEPSAKMHKEEDG